MSSPSKRSGRSRTGARRLQGALLAGGVVLAIVLGAVGAALRTHAPAPQAASSAGVRPRISLHLPGHARAPASGLASGFYTPILERAHRRPA